jgi:hypothetical protein
VVLYTGPAVNQFSDWVFAAPISALWAWDPAGRLAEGLPRFDQAGAKT